MFSFGIGRFKKPTSYPKDAASTLDDILSEQVDDAVIISEMKSLNQLIETHVNEFISTTPINKLEQMNYSAVKGRVEKALEAFLNSESQMHIKELTGLLIDVRTRKSAVRYLIAWTLFSGISNYGDSKRSLLPSELISFLNQITPPKVEDDWQLFQAALCKWRAMSMFLLFRQKAPKHPHREEELLLNIQQITAYLTDALEPFHKTQIGSKSRDVHLSVLIRKTAVFGLLLFSQPVSWSVQWESSFPPKRPLDKYEVSRLMNMGSDYGELIVFPGLEKIDVEKGSGRYKRKPVSVLGVEVDRHVEVGPSMRIRRLDGSK